MEAADAELLKDGRAGVQKVMVVLSDGAANEGQSCLDTTTKVKKVTVITPDPDPHCMQPCQTAVNDATTYKNSAGSAKVLVYTILYGDQSNGANCQTYQQNDEVPAITSLTAMQAMASPGNYYPDPDPTNLTDDLPADRLGSGRGHVPHRPVAHAPVPVAAAAATGAGYAFGR